MGHKERKAKRLEKESQVGLDSHKDHLYREFMEHGRKEVGHKDRSIKKIEKAFLKDPSLDREERHRLRELRRQAHKKRAQDREKRHKEREIVHRERELAHRERALRHGQF